MASLGEIEKALTIIEKERNYKIVILHCVAIYPPENKDLNLKNITMMQNTFGYPVGFSDHSLGFVAPLTSVALGACVIEKHFTTDVDLPGWDHVISANPEEMKKIVKQSKIVYELLGNFKRTVSEAEEKKKKVFRRSIVLNKSLKAEDVIREEDISLKRPGTGFSPDEMKFVVGRKLKRDFEADCLLTKDDII
jgi:N-acetylneuraminate synthase